MSNTNTNLFPANEIVGALGVSELNAEQAKAFAANPNQAIAALGVDTMDIEFKVVENSGKDVHITLPFYTEVDAMHAEMIKDETLNQISGGEIFISIGIVGGIMAGVGIAGALGVGVTTIGFVGGAIGGIAGGIIVAGAIAGGIAGADASIREKEGKGK